MGWDSFKKKGTWLRNRDLRPGRVISFLDSDLCPATARCFIVPIERCTLSHAMEEESLSHHGEQQINIHFNVLSQWKIFSSAAPDDHFLPSTILLSTGNGNLSSMGVNTEPQIKHTAIVNTVCDLKRGF